MRGGYDSSFTYSSLTPFPRCTRRSPTTSTATSWVGVHRLSAAHSRGDPQMGDRQDLHSLATSPARCQRGGGIGHRGGAGGDRQCRCGCHVAFRGPSHRHSYHPRQGVEASARQGCDRVGCLSVRRAFSTRVSEDSAPQPLARPKSSHGPPHRHRGGAAVGIARCGFGVGGRQPGCSTLIMQDITMLIPMCSHMLYLNLKFA